MYPRGHSICIALLYSLMLTMAVFGFHIKSTIDQMRPWDANLLDGVFSSSLGSNGRMAAILRRTMYDIFNNCCLLWMLLQVGLPSEPGMHRPQPNHKSRLRVCLV